MPGYIRDVRFRNLTVSGKPGTYRVQITGADEKHEVRGVTFDNVELPGEKLGVDSARLQVGQHVDGIRFDSSRR